MENYFINPDIRLAETLPASFYQSQNVFELLKVKVFERTWQWIGDFNTLLPSREYVYPFFLLDGFLSEPMILVRDKNNITKCLSNVCTHRANIIIDDPCHAKNLVCNYHGRQFQLDGRFKMMPEFKEAQNFPRPCDNLHQFKMLDWNRHLFVGLDPVIDLSEVLNAMEERIGFMPLDEFKLEESLNKDYFINCHWALYCDNYLEGFHIPFVHEDLNTALDYGAYTTELYEHMNVQIGYSDGDDETFDLPVCHPDYGRNVAAFYFWIFPNMMFNFYPWGLSINIVKPLSMNNTQVSFYSYVYNKSKMNKGAGNLLDKVEMEDEKVVESVHRGLQSRYYNSGRFSPTRETGVHHFHRLLAEFLNK